MQWADDRLRLAINSLGNNAFTNTEHREFRCYKLDKGILYHENPKTQRRTIVIPDSLRDNLITNIHEELGYYGRSKVEATIRPRYYFPHMTREINKGIKSCDILS